VTDLGNETCCYGMILRVQEVGLYRIMVNPAATLSAARARYSHMNPKLHANTRACFDIVLDSEF